MSYYETWRKEKDASFKEENSPLPEELRENFIGLDYYPVNPDLVFAVDLEPDPTLEITTLQMSKGTIKEYKRLGWFNFIVDGTPQRLAVYSYGDDVTDTFYIPFTDTTNGLETYAGGRYFDAWFDEGKYQLDFNYAYSPYCAYNDKYTCPIPSSENKLMVPILAGEKIFNGH